MTDAGLALSLERVTLVRKSRTILRDVTMSLRKGERVALTGPSGAGKTTMVRVLLGLETPDGGVVRVGDAVASAGGRIVLPPERRGIAVVFQDLALWPHLTVDEHLGFVLAAQRVPAAERRARIELTLERTGLAGLRRRSPSELSGGERQRVAIARAFVVDPASVVLDEPLANLDVVGKSDLLGLLRRMLDDGERAALYVTHDPSEIASFAQRVVVVEGGHVVQMGTLEELRRAPGTSFVAALTAAARGGE